MGSSESDGSRAVTCNICAKTTPQKDTLVFDEHFYCSECTTTVACEECEEPVSIPKDSVDSSVLCGDCADNQGSDGGINWTALGKAILVIMVPFVVYSVGSGGASPIELLPRGIPQGAVSIGAWILLYLLYRLFKLES